MSLQWIDTSEYPLDSLLLFESFQIELTLGVNDPAFEKAMGLVLTARPDVVFVFAHRCPPCVARMDALRRNAPEQTTISAQALTDAKNTVLAYAEDFLIYTTPQKMAHCCDFIYGWDEQRLYEMAQLHGAVVLDVGSGSGRLAFAAAKQAKEVYAVEPVATLRAFIREKAALDGVKNLRVTDGFAANLPYPDDTFDVAMSGHVVGDDYDGEIAELKRVVRPGGWLLDCPGDQRFRSSPNEGLIARGWEEMAYTSPAFGTKVYRYRTKVVK